MGVSRQLRSLLYDPERFVVIPGVVDAMSALLAEQAGFEALFVTGAGIANVHFGVPDIGLITMTEVLERVRRICRIVAVPVLADADTGYGNAISVVRTVREFEEAGVAGIVLEDQVSPKRCGHFEGKGVISLEEMLEKIHAFKYARRQADLVLVARTDALAVHGLHEAIRRGQAYAEAGADLIFVEAATSRAELGAIAQSIRAPTLANMVEGGRTPLCTATELQALGFRAVLFANTGMRVAAAALQDAYRILKAEGTSASLLDRMLAWSQRQELVGLPEFQELETYLAGGRPPTSDVRSRL